MPCRFNLFLYIVFVKEMPIQWLRLPYQNIRNNVMEKISHDLSLDGSVYFEVYIGELYCLRISDNSVKFCTWAFGLNLTLLSHQALACEILIILAYAKPFSSILNFL